MACRQGLIPSNATPWGRAPPGPHAETYRMLTLRMKLALVLMLALAA